MKTDIRAAFAWALVAITGAAAGCGMDMPATSPVLQITSPVQNQPVPVGQTIPVTFKVGGKDVDSAGKMIDFKLQVGSDTIMPGVGQVIAYFDGLDHGIVARTATAAEPLLVPGANYAKAQDLITAGTHTIQLWLQYNDGKTLVDPQRHAEVTVLIQ